MRLNMLLMGLALIQLLGFSFPSGRAAQSAISATNNQAVLDFPNKITFQVDLQSSAEISQAWLEYGVEQLTCGKLIAKSVPDFDPGAAVSVQWSWEMKQSGSLPPGAKIWWRWNVKDAAGNSLVTDAQTITWLDGTHPWQTLTQGGIALHWYNGGDDFGRQLLDNAVKSLEMLDKEIGLKPDGVINLYIYASPEELTDSVFFMPDWTGGLAYGDYNIILIGIRPEDLEWGLHATTHELTHVLVGRLTFSCLGDLPTWLNEGLAEYSEGEWNAQAQEQLKEAVASDEIMSVRSLSSSFPEDADKANLAYTQSKSLVSFLIKTYQKEKILSLLTLLSQGTAIDPALSQVYGFNQDGLEDAWRAEMQARPRTAAQAAPTPALTPSPVPTIVPISGVPPVVTVSPPRVPAANENAPTDFVGPPQNTTVPNFAGLSILLICGVGLCGTPLLLVGGIAVFFAVNRKKG
jgi:hypothetical protein